MPHIDSSVPPPRRSPATVFAAALAATLVGSALAQAPTQKPDGRAFVPPEPRSEVWVDFATMREIGIWDGVSRSVMGTFLPMIEQQLGFRLEEIDRLRGYPQAGPIAEGQSDTGVVIFEGSDKVITPAGAPGTTLEKIGGHEAVVVPSYGAENDPSLWVAPKSGVLVYGARHLVEPLLLGKLTPGVTPPELLSLVAGRGIVAHVAVTCDDTVRRGLVEALGAGEAATGPDFLMLRMRVELPADAADEPQIHLDGKLRFADATKGPQELGAHLRTSIDGLKKHPRFAALKKIWNLIELRVDQRDVEVHIPLGGPREAGGLFALAAPLLMFTAAAPQAVAVPVQGQVEEVVVEDVTEPPPPPPAPAPAPPRAPGGGQENGGGRGGDD